MKLLLVAVILAVAVHPLPAKNCCLPQQVEFVQATSGGFVVNQKAQRIEDVSYISIDGINKRVAMRYNETIGSTVINMWLIQNFKEGMVYSINLRSKACTKSKINVPMPPTCVPDDAKPGPKVVYGGGASALNCQTYSWRVEAAGTVLENEISVVIDGDDCYPLGVENIGKANDNPIVETSDYFNFTKGIKDPSVFIPPPSCNQVQPTLYKAKRQPGLFGLYL